MKSGSMCIFLTVAGLALTACSTPSKGPVVITKVNPYHLDTARTIKTDDAMVGFEPRRLLRGAVEGVEQRERFGNYFTIFWTSKTKAPATVRFEYRQGTTGPKILVKEQVVDRPKHSNTTKFEVIGDDYHTNGKVTQWKASIIENGTVVAEYKSYLWQ